MGGFYLSLQVPSNDTNKISEALEKLCTKYSSANMRLYYGQPINGWTGIYPPIQTTVESFAKDLSEEMDDFVLLLGSYDEDEFHCQFYRHGLVTGEFEVGGAHELDNKKRDQISETLQNLSRFCDENTIATIKDMLFQSENETFSSHLLQQFAQKVGIQNTLTGFDYINREGTEGFDVETSLTPLPKGKWSEENQQIRAARASRAPRASAANMIFDMDSPQMEPLVNMAIANKEWMNNPQIMTQLKALERFGLKKEHLEQAVEKYKQNPNPERDKRIANIARMVEVAREAKSYNGPTPKSIELPDGKIITAQTSFPELINVLGSINQGKGPWVPSVEQLAALIKWLKPHTRSFTNQ